MPKEKKETNSDYDKNDMIYVKYWWTLFKLIFIYFQNEEELSDFTVEIEILHELRHENIIGLLDAYYHNNQLWVSKHISVVYIFRISHNSKLDEAPGVPRKICSPIKNYFFLACLLKGIHEFLPKKKFCQFGPAILPATFVCILALKAFY